MKTFTSEKKFSATLVSKNTLDKIMQEIAEKAGWNTSCYRRDSPSAQPLYAASALYDQGFPEALIRKITGHRSDLALVTQNIDDLGHFDVSTAISETSQSCDYGKFCCNASE